MPETAAMVAVAESGPPLLSVLPIATPIALAAALLGYRFYVYSQIEYITAAMLSRWMPKGGARIVQVGGGTRELFYYPKDVELVTVVGEDVNVGLMTQAGSQTNVAVTAKRQSAANLGFLADASQGGMVVVRSLAAMSDAQAKLCMAEAQRVLRPGAPLVFIERIEADASPLRPLLTSGRPVARPSALEALLSTKGFERVQVDVAMEGQDPHAVGVAFRSNAAAPAAPLSSSSGGKAAGGGSKRSKGPSTGFGGS